MSLKNEGKVRTGKTAKRKKYRPIKCECGEKINIDLCLEVEDFDYVDSTKSSIYLYCPMCSLQHEYKL